MANKIELLILDNHSESTDLRLTLKNTTVNTLIEVMGDI